MLWRVRVDYMLNLAICRCFNTTLVRGVFFWFFFEVKSLQYLFPITKSSDLCHLWTILRTILVLPKCKFTEHKALSPNLFHIHITDSLYWLNKWCLFPHLAKGLNFPQNNFPKDSPFRMLLIILILRLV